MTLSHVLFGILGFFPGLIWLFFFLQEDAQRPEPKRLIFSTFIFGGLITFVVLPFQIAAKQLLLAGGVLDANIVHLFILAAIEEILKFGVVYGWIRSRKEFDEPIDAMIYMIIASLGFATVENIATAIRAPNGFELLTLRFVGATLLHALASGLVGYYWARGIIRCREWAYVLWGLFMATLFHTLFNYLMITWGPGLKITVVLTVIAFILLRDFEALKRPAVLADGGKCLRPF